MKNPARGRVVGVVLLLLMRRIVWLCLNAHAVLNALPIRHLNDVGQSGIHAESGRVGRQAAGKLRSDCVEVDHVGLARGELSANG